MQTRSHQGAVIAGGLLLAIPVLDILLGAASPGFVHFVVGAFGAGLIVISRNL